MVNIKTLIINGSPRKNGDTIFLIKNLVERIYGEFKIVNTYTDNISPCIDCRKCREKSECVINDEMQDVYKFLEICDNIVIASPIYFSELTGKLLDFASRLQMYFSQKYFRHEEPNLKSKKGVVLLVGGGTGSSQKAYDTATCLLKYMNTKQIYPLICSHHTDYVSATEDKYVIEHIKKAAVFLNESC